MLLVLQIYLRWWRPAASILSFWSLTVGLIILVTLDRANYCAGFAFDDIHNAYEAFEASSKHGALKVVVTMPELLTNGSS